MTTQIFTFQHPWVNGKKKILLQFAETARLIQSIVKIVWFSSTVKQGQDSWGLTFKYVIQQLQMLASSSFETNVFINSS